MNPAASGSFKKLRCCRSVNARPSGTIEFTIGPALPTLDAMLAQGLGGQLDLAFVDANKEDYLTYYES